MKDFAFGRPLGLALAGGGALGAWQAGALDAVARLGLVFDAVIGFSAGSLAGAGYFLGLQAELLDRWRNVDRDRILRWRPRLAPFSLFSGEAVGEAASYAVDEEAAKRQGRCALTVVTLRAQDRMPVYARFTPGGREGWDGPLHRRLLASCAIPWIFPPVTLEEPQGPRRHVDGGFPGKELLRLDALAHCKDVVVLEMVRPEELGRRRWTPLGFYDQMGREIVHRQVSHGIDSLLRRPGAPRVFRLGPSRVLDYSMLAFKDRHCAPAVELGEKDGEGFLRDPAARLVRRVENGASN